DPPPTVKVPGAEGGAGPALSEAPVSGEIQRPGGEEAVYLVHSVWNESGHWEHMGYREDGQPVVIKADGDGRVAGIGPLDAEEETFWLCDAAKRGACKQDFCLLACIFRESADADAREFLDSSGRVLRTGAALVAVGAGIYFLAPAAVNGVAWHTAGLPVY